MQFIQTRLRFVAAFILIILTLSLAIVYTKFGTGILEVPLYANFFNRNLVYWKQVSSNVHFRKWS